MNQMTRNDKYAFRTSLSDDSVRAINGIILSLPVGNKLSCDIYGPEIHFLQDPTLSASEAWTQA